MGTIGNTFDNAQKKWGHARKVWREIKSQYPSGGTIQNISDWVAVGKIPSGTAAKFDMSAKTIIAYTDEQITGAEDASSLGINGYLQEDIIVSSENTIGTGTVIYAGEIYEYMFNEEVVAKLKGLATTPQIVWVQ